MAIHHPEQIIHANGIDICTDAYGDRANPAMLLIMGAGASMLLWEEGLCQGLADAGRFVIRFDNRDVGRTTCCAPGEPNYTLQDMADDAVAVLDHYRIDKAHICGASMGGMITQLVGLNHPDRVLSLIVIMSSPDPAAVTNPMEGKAGALSPPTQEVMAAAAAGATLDWSDTDAVLANRVEMFGVLAGSAYPYDADSRRVLFRKEIERAGSIASGQNHGLVVGASARWIDRLAEITAPTLVIHGDEDPILPLDHGQAIADGIAGSEMLVMAGVGHELPDQEVSRLIATISEFTS